jgi:hypothetical protein
LAYWDIEFEPATAVKTYWTIKSENDTRNKILFFSVFLSSISVFEYFSISIFSSRFVSFFFVSSGSLQQCSIWLHLMSAAVFNLNCRITIDFYDLEKWVTYFWLPNALLFYLDFFIVAAPWSFEFNFGWNCLIYDFGWGYNYPSKLKPSNRCAICLFHQNSNANVLATCH